MARPTAIFNRIDSSSRPGAGKKSQAPTGAGGKGLGKGIGLKRHRKIMRDSISGITKSDIRRLARRGGVKRISATIYQEARLALRTYLTTILRHVTLIVDMRNHKTVCTTDVVFALQRVGKPVWGFDNIKV